MLKLNSAGGKLDITITDESLFGTGKKGTVVKPSKGNVTRQSHPRGKHQTKPPPPSTSDKGPKGRDKKHSKPVQKELAIKQSKAKTRQEKKPTPISVPNVIGVKTEKSKSYDTGVISKTDLENILLLLNNKGASTEDNGEIFVKPDNSNVDKERKELRTESVSSKTIKKHQGNENQVDAEDKRLQWKRELDEQVLLKKKIKAEEKKEDSKDIDEQYNPWGRPGAGAPIRSQSGNVLANYHQRTTRNDIPEHENVTAKETFGASLVLSTHTSSTVTVSQTRSSPVTTLANTISDVKRIIPVAMRSSFPIGAPGLVAHDTQTKRLQEMQWKQELQKQIEGKKERQRQRKLKEDQEDFLNLSWNAMHQKQSPQQQYLNDASPPQHTTDIKSQVSESYKKKPCEHGTPPSTQDSSVPLPTSLNGSLKTHARGFGMQLMDPRAKEEAEKKRLKKLEHQHAIQEQVEEKRRIKQQEREQRLKNEAIEEARFAEEREKLNRAFLMEQKQKREKEEEAKRISNALQQSVLEAYQASQQAKADKRKKHLGDISQDKRIHANMSRSYVVSRATSEAQHTVPDTILGIPTDNNISVLSNHELAHEGSGRKPPKTKYTDRTSEASTDRLYSAHPSYKDIEKEVPRLNLSDRNSPPVPTLRNKITEKYEITSPKSCSTVSPSAIKSNLCRTVSSHSEPCNGSLALSSTNIGTKGSDVRGMVTQGDKHLFDSRVLENDDLPFTTLEVAFMVPFHRTDSATLPAPPETQEPNLSQGVTNVSTRVRKGKEVSAQRLSKNAVQNNGISITPIYRTLSSHLKADQAEPETSPWRTRGNKTIQARHQSQSTKSKASQRSYSKALKMESEHKLMKQNTNTQQRQGKRLEKRALKDAPSVISSNHQAPPELLQTARQEMILQQLAALRQGLIMKERELKQDPGHHFNL